MSLVRDMRMRLVEAMGLLSEWFDPYEDDAGQVVRTGFPALFFALRPDEDNEPSRQAVDAALVKMGLSRKSVRKVVKMLPNVEDGATLEEAETALAKLERAGYDYYENENMDGYYPILVTKGQLSPEGRSIAELHDLLPTAFGA